MRGAARLDRLAMISRRTLLAAAAAMPLGAAAAAPTVGRIQVAASRIIMPVTIGGAGPFPFILDTGAAVSCIAPRLAARLGLRKLGQRRMSGVGGTVDLDFYEAKDIVFGGGVAQGAAAFGGVAPEGWAGLLAAGLFTTHDSDIDFDASEWRVYWRGRPPRDGWTRLDAGIDERSGAGSAKLFVNATLDGRSLRLLLDTGAPPEVMLFPHGTRRSGLWSGDRPFAPERLRGIGGVVERLGRVVRAQRLDIGGFGFDAPLIRLHDPKDFADVDYDGLLGLAVIERLNLSTEVRRGALWAQPSRRAKPPEAYGASGVWFDRLDGARARVATVSPGSPAADAGLKIGDVLTGVHDWRAYIRRFAAPPGTQIPVVVDTVAGPMPRIVTLRAYL